MIYLYDEFVPRNINKSINYLSLAAKQYDALSQYILGELYYENKYIPKDIKKSIYYFKEASSFNHPYVKNYLGVIYKNGKGVNKNIMMAIEYFNEAIRFNEDQLAVFNLARIYYFGIDVDKNIPKAIELLEKDKEQQNIQIICFLYLIYLFQNSVEKANYYREILNDKKVFYGISRNLIGAFYFIKNYDLLECNQNYFVVEYLQKMVGEYKNRHKVIHKKNHSKQSKNINNEFYEGLGFGLIT